MIDSFTLVRFTAEDKSEVRDTRDAIERTEIWEAVAPYRQLYMLQIIRYLVELLIELGYKAMAIKSEDIPYFSEIFGLFYNDNSYFRSRKTWDKL